ncbi:hypothetical protein N7492_009509 [Penicillium capsulatum]|uniref:Uncharacterized protein n=1 Tax=Penicillium capsulatum TaxID=69766 RepID=A0A9W9HSM0_9EURO|nr:hypothetical protein N7492_009509 [Penicillium capsulatum]KAJ6106899.1 hypothetical protein N7512_010416 [Penicillium capsulatum]
MRSTIALAVIALLPAVQGAPANSTLARRCGIVNQFYHQKADDYNQYGTGDWLNHWWDSNTDNWKDGDGFAKAFGHWGLGNFNFNCHDDGSDSNCNVDKVCDNEITNNKDDARQTYYVLTSISNLHAYFKRLSEALTTAGVGAALSKDNWAQVFYDYEKDDNALILKEILNGVAIAAGVILGLAAFGTGAVAFAGAAGTAMVGGAMGGANLALDGHQDDTFEKAADLGGILGSFFTDTMKSFTQQNDDLMDGKIVNDHDIRSYIADGAMMTQDDQWGKNQIVDALNAQIIGISINQLWRQQRVFVMGGGACGDGQGIGDGPQDTMVCRDGKAWYLYYWAIPGDRPKTGQGQYGFVHFPPGAQVLNKGDYKDISVQDVINSSLDAWNVAGLDYNEDTRKSRAEDAVQQGWANPAQKGASWEGIFNIPVCDVGWAVDGDLHRKEWVLQPYGKDSRPNWCGPICEGDHQKTIDFINAAQMGGVLSPKYQCGLHKDYNSKAG